jgi:hypothetical protein
MKGEAEGVLRSSELLPDAEKREAASAILRRSMELDVPPLCDDQLVSAAEELFLKLDREEAGEA